MTSSWWYRPCETHHCRPEGPPPPPGKSTFPDIIGMRGHWSKTLAYAIKSPPPPPILRYLPWLSCVMHGFLHATTARQVSQVHPYFVDSCCRAFDRKIPKNVAARNRTNLLADKRRHAYALEILERFCGSNLTVQHARLSIIAVNARRSCCCAKKK